MNKNKHMHIPEYMWVCSHMYIDVRDPHIDQIFTYHLQGEAGQPGVPGEAVCILIQMAVTSAHDWHIHSPDSAVSHDCFLFFYLSSTGNTW